MRRNTVFVIWVYTLFICSMQGVSARNVMTRIDKLNGMFVLLEKIKLVPDVSYVMDDDLPVSQREHSYVQSRFFVWSNILMAVLMGGVICYHLNAVRKSRKSNRETKGNGCLRCKLSSVAGNTAEKNDVCSCSSQQRDLMAHLNRYLLDKQELRDINMNSKKLVSTLGTNKNLLSSAVKAVTGKTLMKYIRSLQLEEARRMIEHHPELTIEAIITESGFNSSSTFYRLFRKRYGVSPAKYRSLL